jgi:hypothetical protein
VGVLYLETRHIGKLAKDWVDLELVEVNRFSELTSLSAEEDLVESRVFGNGFKGLADSHASC